MEEPDINDIQPLGGHFTESPFFILGVVVLIILIALFLRRMLFGNTHKEYKYNPDD
jgi:hypothetical protein